MRSKLTPLVLVFLSASVLQAQPITFETDKEILVVRVSQRLDDALVELIGPRDGSLLCVALGADGSPLATTTGFAQMGRVSFDNLKASSVSSVACRYN